MKTTTNIVTFENDNFGNLRLLNREGKPWFIAKEPCYALGIRTNSLRSILDEDEISNVNSIDIGRSSGRSPLIVSESGLYSLILRSRKPEAKAFKRWITHEVLPAIRETGSYSANQQKQLPAPQAESLGEYKKLISAQKELIEQQQRYILSLKSQQTVKTPLLPSKTEKLTYSTSEAIKYVQAWAPELTREWLFVKLRESNLMEWGSLEPTLEGVASGILVRKSYYGRKYSHVTVKGIDWLIEKATGMTTFKQRVAK